MRLPVLLSLLAAMAFVSPAMAQNECDPDDQSQMGMNICARVDYEAADASLNKTYGEIMKRLGDSPDGKKQLQVAQRAWITFRDAECAFANSDTESGSMHPMVMSQCFEAMTIDRTKQLADYLTCEEGDASCPVPAE